jgi:hypothetical protein
MYISIGIKECHDDDNKNGTGGSTGIWFSSGIDNAFFTYDGERKRSIPK